MDSTSSRNNRFDRTLAGLIGIPGVLQTQPTTVRATTPLIGDAQTFIVQTFRRREESSDGIGGSSEQYIFIEYVDDTGNIRLVVPPNVVRVILRQHDALTDRARSRAAKQSAADRKARGEVPGFMRKKKPRK